MKNPRTPSWEAWYGKRVKVKPEHPDEFSDVKGTVISIEDGYLRVKFDKPVHIRGVGMVGDDLFMPYTVRKIRGNPGTNWHVDRAEELRFLKGAKHLDRIDRAFMEGKYKEELHAAEESRRRGMNPKRRRRNPSSTKSVGKSLLPTLLIGTAIVAAIAYVGRQATEE